jgi:hypothetical protein
LPRRASHIAPSRMVGPTGTEHPIPLPKGRTIPTQTSARAFVDKWRGVKISRLSEYCLRPGANGLPIPAIHRWRQAGQPLGQPHSGGALVKPAGEKDLSCLRDERAHPIEIRPAAPGVVSLDEFIDFLRALLEGSSCMRWLARAYAFGAVQDLWNGLTMEEALACRPPRRREPGWSRLRRSGCAPCRVYRPGPRALSCGRSVGSYRQPIVSSPFLGPFSPNIHLQAAQ